MLYYGQRKEVKAMSKYTTGEIAKLCGVSVRTVQYYDSRAILIPSELSEGGRRLYSEEDLRRMKIICFLREAGISINSIAELLEDSEPEKVISVLLEQQELALKGELDELEHKLDIIAGIKRELKGFENFSVESIGDIAYRMENKNKLKRLHGILLASGIPVSVLQLFGILMWIFKGMWQWFAAYVLVAVPYGICISKYYFKRVKYICPECHELFKPSFKEEFWAKHTPTLRKLSCPKCGKKGFCVEVYADDE